MDILFFKRAGEDLPIPLEPIIPFGREGIRINTIQGNRSGQPGIDPVLVIYREETGWEKIYPGSDAKIRLNEEIRERRRPVSGHADAGGDNSFLEVNGLPPGANR